MSRIKGHPEERLRSQRIGDYRYLLQRKMCGNPRHEKGRVRPRCYLVRDDQVGLQHQITLTSTEFWQLWESTRTLEQLWYHWSKYKQPYEFTYDVKTLPNL